MIAPATSAWNTNDQVRFLPQRSCSKKISALFAITLQRLGHDADIRDSGTFDRVHDGGKRPEGNILVGAHKDELTRGVANLLPQLVANLVDIDRVVPHKYPLLLVDGDHHALFGDFLDGPGLGNIDFDAGLQ